MKVNIIAVGKLKAGPERELLGRYLDRFAKAAPALGLELGAVTELPESRASTAQARKQEEADAIRRKLGLGAFLCLLDEQGKTIGSTDFADRLGNLRDRSQRDIFFVIGGADGLDPTLLSEADLTLCFGRMTWPHQLVRIMLAEQIYRAATILAGHPYHRS